MNASLKLPFVCLTFTVCASLGGNFTLHRTKRDLTIQFWDKHVTFVYEGTPITFNFLKQELGNFANEEKRVLHTFIIVFYNKAENKEKKMTLFKTMLNTVMSKKIRSNVCVKSTKDIPRVCKTGIKNNKRKIPKNQKSTNFSGYRLCLVSLADLGPRMYMANFNPQNKNAPCKYSAQGMFYLGAKPVKYKEQSDKNTDWFKVNHLEKSEMYGEVLDCKK